MSLRQMAYLDSLNLKRMSRNCGSSSKNDLNTLCCCNSQNTTFSLFEQQQQKRLKNGFNKRPALDHVGFQLASIICGERAQAAVDGHVVWSEHLFVLFSFNSNIFNSKNLSSLEWRTAHGLQNLLRENQNDRTWWRWSSLQLTCSACSWARQVRPHTWPCTKQPNPPCSVS